MFGGCQNRARCLMAAALLCALVGVCGATSASAGARATRRHASASSYPAGATRPALIPRGSEYARAAARPRSRSRARRKRSEVAYLERLYRLGEKSCRSKGENL